jgi:hydroxymethylglutaryl-CoA lyase
MLNLPSKVKIREVGPRDGFQIQKEFIPTPEKLEIINAVVAAGVSDVEATAFVSPKAVPQMRDAGEIISQVPRNGTIYSALVPNLKGAQNAMAAGVDELVVVISASNAHNQANVRRTVDESIADLDAIFELANEKGVSILGSTATAFGCPYQGDIPDADILKLIDAYKSRGANALILADTTGLATPVRMEKTIKMVQDRYPETEIVLHLHDNRGTAMANLLTAMMCGATTFDTALGGLGGCPYVPQAAGNLPTEDVVFMLEDMDIETGIDLEALIRAALRLEKIIGKMLPGQVMKSGPRDPKRAAELCGIKHS